MLKNYIIAMNGSQKKTEIIYQRIDLVGGFYPLNALEPHISQEIMDDHYNGNHKLYEKNLNLALSQLEESKREDIKKNYPDLEKLLQDLKKLPFSPAVRAKIRFYGGGLINHNLFFGHLASQIVSDEEKGKQERVSEDFLKALQRDGFDGLDGLKAKLIEEALDNFVGNIRYEGSYWTWLVLDDNQKMKIIKTAIQDSPWMFNLIPLIGIDMWEHAYVKQYARNKKDYVNRLVNCCLNWRFIDNLHLQHARLKVDKNKI
jgi:superoxide dismutase, Fe-Mn family